MTIALATAGCFDPPYLRGSGAFVMYSDWDCTLEGLPHPPAVRLGLRQVSGLKEQSVQRLVVARQQAPFDNAEDLARRAQLEQHEMKLLALRTL